MFDRLKVIFVYTWSLCVDIAIFFSLGVYYFSESLLLMFIPRRLRAKNVVGEIVLVTGAGGGIGRLIAVKFAKLGARVIAWDINQKGKLVQ